MLKVVTLNLFFLNCKNVIYGTWSNVTQCYSLSQENKRSLNRAHISRQIKYYTFFPKKANTQETHESEPCTDVVQVSKSGSCPEEIHC